MGNPLQELEQFGQSPWFDNISRDLIESGELARMVREDGLRGLTSNPTIFEKAIGSGTRYDGAIERLVASGTREPQALFEALAIDDIRAAADVLAPVYEASAGGDGFVSLEVSPLLARDTEKTVREARDLFARVERPNVMIKVPGTLEGLPAVQTLIGEGINVNVTLIFSVKRYEAVMDAYLAGLETLASRPYRRVGSVASVASFFVSRIDTAVDARLQELLASSASGGICRAGIEALAGKAAVANARLAYQRFRETFSSKRFKALRSRGARVQRLLWASTGTKNPAYPDILYVSELIGADTVNTMPPATWAAFRDHGSPKDSLAGTFAQAQAVKAALAEAGIELEAVAARLEEDGVKAFSDSFEALLAVIERKASALASAA